MSGKCVETSHLWADTFPKDRDMSGGCKLMSKTWSSVCDGVTLPTDPYREIKSTYNNLIASLLPHVEERIARSDDPVRLAFAYAAGGNLIDFGSNVGFDESSVEPLLDTIPDLEFAIDDTGELVERLGKAETLVVVSDNCGELLLDKAMLATLKRAWPGLDITYMTRELPILNDTIPAEAEAFGLGEYARITGNGDATHVPGTVFEALSPEALSTIREADVVIAKGMGNFETMRGYKAPNVFHLFMNKCEHLRPWLDCELKSLVCVGPED